ncbi:MAG: hypothetical protein JHC33_03295 [Ignisphaera sp.]|nr:hypothetical protein [Ignisphaera sp.]
MFKPGDILLYQAESALKFSTIIPKLIQLSTGNEVTHVALYLGKDPSGNHLVLDALADGILIKSFSDNEIFSRKDSFRLHGIASLDIEIPTVNLMIEACVYSRKPYGFVTILNLFLQHGKTLLYPNKPWTTWMKSKTGFICSEVCQRVLENLLNENHIIPPFLKEANLTEPDDYLVAPWKVILL